MNPGKKYRGRMKNVVLDYVKDMEEDLKKAKKDRVFITHSGCDKEIVDEVKNYLKQLDVFDEIYETRARRRYIFSLWSGNIRSSFYCRRIISGEMYG